MKNITLVIGIIIALTIGAGVGYSFGKGSKDNRVETKKMEDAISMMKEQSASIQKMAEMMKSGGSAMQEMSMKYKDDEAMVKGKDLQMLGEKYLKDAATTSGNSDSMKQMMGK